MKYDPLSIFFTTPNFPKSVRLGMPNAFDRIYFRTKPEAWAIIRVSSAKLMAELAKPHHADSYPILGKLNSLKSLLLNSKPLEAPILDLSDQCNIHDFSFLDGRHRIKVFTNLGATEIPVAVPWYRADEFILYFS